MCLFLLRAPLLCGFVQRNQERVSKRKRTQKPAILVLGGELIVLLPKRRGHFSPWELTLSAQTHTSSNGNPISVASPFRKNPWRNGCFPLASLQKQPNRIYKQGVPSHPNGGEPPRPKSGKALGRRLLELRSSSRYPTSWEMRTYGTARRCEGSRNGSGNPPGSGCWEKRESLKGIPKLGFRFFW